MHADLLIKNGRVVLPHTGVAEVAVAIRNGKIDAIVTDAAAVDADEVIDAGGCYVLPGRIEPHAHFGYGSLSEDFLTETRAAAAAGVTTVFTYWRKAVPYAT